MVTIRSANEIIQSLVDFFRLAQPDLDTKQGTVARDLFIEAPASQISLLYDQVGDISSKQSMRLVVGSDLDKLAKNFGIIRKQSTPSTGTALLTFASINAPININQGDTVIANNGISYSITAGVAIVPANSNFYKSVASKFADQLTTAGISDQYAIQVTLRATSAGSAGNIGTYSLSRSTTPGVSNVTNVNPFSGGTDQESDSSFRNRVLASFSGSSVGTSLGYLNVALSATGVSDAYIVEPGDPLMTRDGTIVKVNSDGSRTIISEGSGGKVDVVVLGSNLIENKDSFIYIDKSNSNDPTSIKNNVVLGQIAADANKTINRKRIDNIANGVVPAQPIDAILEVTGSISGSNFLPKSVDLLGRVSGNYDLVKDTGIYGGSPWGFDTFVWINNQISFSEDIIKGQLNGQDAVTFTDVLTIPLVQQNISITNENSIVTSDRSIIQLLHTPSTNVTRVFNVHTGERYIVTNQNIDNTGTFNTSGRIQISGNTLPSPSDQLQVDYSWIVNYDQYSDYDGLYNTQNARPVTDSIDWGFASMVNDEKISFIKDPSNGFFIGTASHPVSAVLSAKTFLEVNGVVSKITSGIFVNRLSVTINNLSSPTQSVDSITFKNNNSELYSTAQNNGSFSNVAVVLGINIVYSTSIILPNDTVAKDGDNVTVILNSTDVFHSTDINGSSSGIQITIPSVLITTVANTLILKVTYIANISDLFSLATTALPVSRIGNGFILNSNVGFNNFSPVNLSRRENQSVQKNTSNQFYIDLTALIVDFSLAPSQIISVIRLSDNLELWNSDNLGSVIVSNSGNYQLILNGVNAPAVGDKVLVIYYTYDLRKFQPFSYYNSLINGRINTLKVDSSTNKLYVPINSFTTQSLVNFTIIEPNTDIALFTISDGQLTDNGTSAFLTSATSFSTLLDLTNKKVRITGSSSVFNNGLYDITGYDLTSNTLTITNIVDKITSDQICIIRIADGKEVWNYGGVINIENNKLLLSNNNFTSANDKVYVMLFNFNNLRKTPTKITGVTVDQVVNTGVITVAGTTLFKAQDIVFTSTNTGLKLNIAEALRKALGISSAATIPSNIKIARITKLEKVITVSASNDEVLQILTTYDLKNTTIQNNLLYTNEVLADPTLHNLDIVLPNTSNNTLNTSVHNLPALGDKIRITFYYTVDGDSENLSYTKNGTLYTNKKFSHINKVYISSGFKASQSTKFTGASFTQPSLGSRYKVFYNYLGPKPNERIVVKYNYNKIITDVTFSIENTRPINADVLVRQSKRVLTDLTINVVIADSFLSSTTTVLQNLRDQLISAMTPTKLGQIVDAPTLINVAQAVNGIARARILYFNKTGNQGQVQSIQAQQDEYLIPNNVVINTETR
jgi:uncharacterized phage protein gp47/JayE/glycerophosphoryl diester phosphodiesterase